MARDVEELVLSISADTAQIRRALKRLEGDTARSTRHIERQFTAMNSRVNRSALAMGRSVAVAFAGVASARGAQNLIDTSVRIQNALRVTGLEGEALSNVYDDLFVSAQKNFAPLESLASLYSRIGLAQKELGVTSQEIVDFTDKIAMALRVQGTTAQEARGALIQLSQAMGGGIVRAEEFNSIVEGAPSILRAAAAGIKETGGSIAQLRRLMLDGELSSAAFFRGIEAGSWILEEQLAGAEITVSQAFVRLQNVLVDAAGRLNEGTSASETLAGALEWLSEAIANLDFNPFVTGIGRGINSMRELIGWVDAAGAKLGELTGLDQVGVWVRNRQNQNNIDTRINSAFGDQGPDGRGDRPTVLPAIEVKDRPEPISIADYPVGGAAGNGGGGGKSARERADEYERLTQRINASVAAMQAENAALAGMNPLVEDYGYALEKARVQQDLLTAAKEAGTEVTPELQREIEVLADKYAFATVEAAKLAESHDEIRQRAEEAFDLARDVTSGLIDGFIEGTSAADMMANALKKVGDALINDVLNNIFKINDAGGGGLLGGLMNMFGLGGGGFPLRPGGGVGTFMGGGLYDKGGYTGPGGVKTPAGVVHKGEVVWSQRDVANAGGVAAVEAMRLGRAGYSNGGPVAMPSMPEIRMPTSKASAPIDVNINVNIEGANGDEHVVSLVKQGVTQGLNLYDKALPTRVNQIAAKPRAR